MYWAWRLEYKWFGNPARQQTGAKYKVADSDPIPHFMSETKPIRLHLGTLAPDATSSEVGTLLTLYQPLESWVNEALPHLQEESRLLHDFVSVADSLDANPRQSGTIAPDDLASAVSRALTALATLDERCADSDTASVVLDRLAIAIAFWAMRHEVPVDAPAPVVNALARSSNRAIERGALAAVYAMMQGFIHHTTPQLAPDLERSNPERPWRLLHVNFAITSIRTGDAAMIRYAFDRLCEALPDERAAFFSEARALADEPHFPAEVRGLLEVYCQSSSVSTLH